MSELPRARNGKPQRDLWRFVEPTGFCWLWTGFCSSDGYGYYSNDTGSDIVHRQAYEQLVGPIPEGFELDHLCRIRACVNPDHLEAVTHAENNRRAHRYRIYPGIRSAQCQRGHPWSSENTVLSPDGSRRCRICRKTAIAAWKKQHRLHHRPEAKDQP